VYHVKVKNRPNMTPAADFDPEDGGDTFLWNIGSQMDYMVLYPRGW
jgi:hypothetical protein